MADKCERILRDLPEDLFKESQLNDLTQSLDEAIKSDNAREKIEQIKRSIEKNGFEKLSRLKQEKYRTLLKVANTEQTIDEFEDKKRGLISVLVGVYAKAKNAGNSVDADGKARGALFNGRLQKELRQAKLFKYFKDLNNISDIAKAMFKEEDAPNDKSAQVARIVKSIYKDQISMLNARGAKIEELEDFIMNQVHNPSKLAQTSSKWSERISDLRDAYKKFGMSNTAKVKEYLYNKAYNRWYKNIRPLIDEDRTFGDMSESKKDSILESMYRNIVIGKSLDDDMIFSSLEKDLESGESEFEHSLEKHRVIHFKSSEAFEQYNKMYGNGSIAQGILSTIDRNSKNISILERMGTMPDLWYKILKNNIIRDSKDTDITKKMAAVDKYYKTVMGRDRQPVDHLWANISSGARSLVSMGSLGGVVLKSLPDLVQELSALRSNGVGFLDRYRAILGQMSILMDKEKQDFLMDSLRVMNVMGHFNNRFIAADDVPGKLTKAMSIYFKANLQEYWDKSMRLGFAGALSRHLANLRDTSFDNLSSDMKKTFNRYGIEEKDWDLIRSNKDAMKNYKGTYYVTPDMASDFTDESMKNHAGKDNLSAKEKKELQESLEFKMQMYFLEETDTAQLTPSAADRAMLIRGHAPGTVAGELLRFISQFKQYSLNVTRRGLGRLLLQNSNDGLMKSILQGNVSTRGLLEYMVSAAIMGYVSTAATSMLKNGYVPDPSKPSVWGSSLVDGGGLGLFGDYLFHNYNQYGQGLIQMSAGPVAGAAANMARLMSTLVDFDNKGHRLSYHQRVLKNVLTLTKQYTPFVNMFYTKAVFHYLLNHHVMNYIDQSYLSQHQAQVRRQNQGNMNLF